jgi:phage regulator Rha-like protein
MSKILSVIPSQKIDRAIIILRNQQVMIDTDLALVYGVTTGILNQAVKRNLERFPKEFMFQITAQEKEMIVENCEHLQHLKFAPKLPFAFTEHGTIMLSSVLKTPTAVKASIQVVKAFVQLREILNTHKDLAKKLEEMESKYDKQFRVVFDAIRQLMNPIEPAENRKPIGYKYSTKAKVKTK